ncbi:MAG: glutathione transferase GstA [Alphaproteobacteria bacterium]|nr:MAG: glutathione transferase GstA [Alphaproteobacteria bacterium]
MKLYLAPGACSQAPHIALLETGLPFEAVKVDLKTKRLETGEDYTAINPKGAVPALALDDGTLLTENAVVLQYIADRTPEARLIPPVGTLARYRALEWLNYIATELHKGFAPLFHPTGEPRAHVIEQLSAKFDYVNARLGDGPYLAGADLSVADLYLFVILGWTRIFHIDLARWPALAAFRARLLERESVREALHAEGFAPK